MGEAVLLLSAARGGITQLRSKALPVALVCLLMLLVGCQSSEHPASSAAGGSGKTQYAPSAYRGSAGLDGKFDGRAPRQQPVVAWRNSVGGDNAWQNEAVMTDRAVFTISDDGVVYALDRANGKQLWTYKLVGPVTSPALTGKLIAVEGSEGVVGLDAGTGVPAWTQPAVHLGALNATADAIYGTTSEGEVVRLNAADGAVVWTAKMNNGGGADVSVVGGQAYTTDAGGYLYGFATGDGHENWRVAPEFHKTWTGVSANTSLVVATEEQQAPPNGTTDTSGGEVVAINPNDGSVRWRASVPVSTGDTAAIAASWIVAPGGNSGLYGLDANTGAIKWQLPGVVPHGHPSIADGVVVIRASSFDGANVDPVVAVDLKTGQELWRYTEPYKAGELPHSGTFAGPPVGDRTVVYTDPYGELVLLTSK